MRKLYTADENGLSSIITGTYVEQNKLNQY